ncbi:hypothetical protein ADL03_05635 [Nocardia sp. NRRL S-836]|nr:hypothetical protein ADL03_05635 [Nocardia sp. NRRL S-836]
MRDGPRSISVSPAQESCCDQLFLSPGESLRPARCNRYLSSTAGVAYTPGVFGHVNMGKGRVKVVLGVPQLVRMVTGE